MNLQDIKDMQAGPELNALILIRLFHKKTEQYDFSMDSDERIIRFAQDGVCIPDYSTDISAAWEVVKRMRQINWWVVINGESDKWNALFYWDPNQESFEAEATDVPEAICKAALLALKVSEAEAE